MIQKYRAWNRAEHYMYYGVGLLPHEDGGHSVVDEKGLLILDMYGSNPVVMQFTGQANKNGKEIYTGDIVEVTVDQWTGAQDKFRGIITYDAKHWRYRLTGKHRAFNLAYADEIEVIGNEYENEGTLKEMLAEESSDE